MNSVLDEDIMDNSNKADALISLFFLGFDVLIYLIIFTLYNCELKNYGSPKQKLYFFMMLDGLLRFISIYTDTYSKNFLQELVFTLIASIQFFLSLSMLEQIFTDKSNDSFADNNNLEMNNKTLFAFLFFCLVFSFKNSIANYGFLSTVQLICVLILISIFYKYMNNKIEIFLSNIQKNYSQFTGKTLISSLPFFIYVYFIIYYVLQLCILFINNKLYESYMSLICIIFKEVGKYLSIFFLIAIYNTYRKYISNNSDIKYEVHNEIPNEKHTIQVYKDEDENENDHL